MKKSLGLLTAQAASKRVGVNRKTLCDWIRSGAGPQRVLIGKRYYYQREALDLWLEKCLIPVACPKPPAPRSFSAPAGAGSAAVA